MSQGKAIVSTTLGVEGIAGVEGRHFLIADQPDAFADQVVDLLQDPGKRRQLGEAARELATSCYSWRSIGERLTQVYADVVAGRGLR